MGRGSPIPGPVSPLVRKRPHTPCGSVRFPTQGEGLFARPDLENISQHGVGERGRTILAASWGASKAGGRGGENPREGLSLGVGAVSPEVDAVLEGLDRDEQEVPTGRTGVRDPAVLVAPWGRGGGRTGPPSRLLQRGARRRHGGRPRAPPRAPARARSDRSERRGVASACCRTRSASAPYRCPSWPSMRSRAKNPEYRSRRER
jgi:hypothetical protein